MTSGEDSGVNGARNVMWRGVALFVAYVALLNTVNIFSRLDEQPDIAPIIPIILEGTSFIAAVPVVFIAWWAFRFAPPDRPPVWRMLAVHAVGVLALSLVHVTLFTLLRQLAYAMIGQSYGFEPLRNFPYELRKDFIGYVIGLACFWAFSRLSRTAPSPSEPPAQSPTFDIRDGARVVRVAVDQILAVSSAGNYVEFVLADGRRPMMRASLARMQAELEPHGLVRTHRSWLVNAARVNELRPESSGDYKVVVGGVEAPVSRRFPDAIARLKSRA